MIESAHFYEGIERITPRDLAMRGDRPLGSYVLSVVSRPERPPVAQTPEQFPVST